MFLYLRCTPGLLMNNNMLGIKQLPLSSIHAVSRKRWGILFSTVSFLLEHVFRKWICPTTLFILSIARIDILFYHKFSESVYICGQQFSHMHVWILGSASGTPDKTNQPEKFQPKPIQLVHRVSSISYFRPATSTKDMFGVVPLYPFFLTPLLTLLLEKQRQFHKLRSRKWS